LYLMTSRLNTNYVPSRKRALPIYKNWLRKNGPVTTSLFSNPLSSLVNYTVPWHAALLEGFQRKLKILLHSYSQANIMASLYNLSVFAVAKHMNYYEPCEIEKIMSFFETDEDIVTLNRFAFVFNTLLNENFHCFVHKGCHTLYITQAIDLDVIRAFADQMSQVCTEDVETNISWEDITDLTIYDGRSLVKSIVLLRDELTLDTFKVLGDNFRQVEKLTFIQSHLSANDFYLEEEAICAKCEEYLIYLFTAFAQLKHLKLVFCPWLRSNIMQAMIPKVQLLQTQHNLILECIECCEVCCTVRPDDDDNNDTRLIAEWKQAWQVCSDTFTRATQITLSVY